MKPSIRLHTRIGTDFLIAVGALVLAMASFAVALIVTQRIAVEVRGQIQPIVVASNQMLEALEQMENAEFLYFGKGAIRGAPIAHFQQNAARFEEAADRASDIVALPEASVRLQAVREHYRDFLITEGQLRSLLAAGATEGAEELNLTRSMDQAAALRQAIRDLRAYKLGLVEEGLGNVLRVLGVTAATSLAATIGGIVLGSLMWRRSWQMIGAPLTALVAGTKELAEGHFVSVEHPAAKRTQELADLQASFNSMAGRLEAMTAELRAANELLEKRVDERTTDLRKANDRLAEMVDELRSLDRMKSDLLGVVSHELLTPINFVTGNASLLQDEVLGDLSENQHRAVASILHGSRRLTRMVRNILDYMELEKGLVIRPEEVAYADVIRSVSSAVSETLLEEGRHLSLSVDTPADLPPVLADPDRIGQILGELLDNAIKFTPDGGQVRVSARVKGDAVETEITDSGPGLPRDLIHRLAEPFFQADLSSTRRHGGLGLGLAIVTRLLTQMGGSLSAESRPGQGSVFRFRLPAAT
ncbi:MAG: HAMP domain-containing protein [Candidatus Sericytochromatia bacterium]|nr:HAMP domain-containing protein [Candidatus Tanganyikabacteria bacterium]